MDVKKKKRRLRKTIKHSLIMIVCCLIVGIGYYFVKSNQIDVKLVNAEQENSYRFENNLSSEYAILVDLDVNKILYQKNAEQKMYPASLTKLMTIYYSILLNDDLDERVSIPSDMMDTLILENASVAGFEAGEEVSMKDLLYGAMLPSGADACIALAVHNEGSEEAFVKKMNAYAKALGMNQTHFTNVTGLQNENHYTTVYDLEILLKEALKNSTFYTIFTSQSYQTSSTMEHPNGILFNSTFLDTIHEYGISNPYIIGEKTGFTTEAGLCLASLGSVKNKNYMFITGKAVGDHTTEPYHIYDALSVYQELGELNQE